MLTKLTSDGVKTLKNNPGRVNEVNKEVEQLGVKVLNQWATLGRVRLRQRGRGARRGDDGEGLVELGSRGTTTNETLTAISRRGVHEVAASAVRILVVGGGRARARDRPRTHASTRSAPELLCAPGNAGIAADARCLEVGADDVTGPGRRRPSPSGRPRRRRAGGAARRRARRRPRGSRDRGLRSAAPRRRGSRARRSTPRS